MFLWILISSLLALSVVLLLINCKDPIVNHVSQGQSIGLWITFSNRFCFLPNCQQIFPTHGVNKKPQESSFSINREINESWLPHMQGTYYYNNDVVELQCLRTRCQQTHLFHINDSHFANDMFHDSAILPDKFWSQNVSRSFKMRSSPKRTLIAVSTCNELRFTIETLDSLRKSIGKRTDIDILVLDDHSTDGTVPYLTKKGYHIVSNSHPTGLTARWNFAYQYAHHFNYANLFYSNNDVIVPSGALDVLIRELNSAVIIVPTTTRKGAGHNPSQALQKAQNLSDNKNSYINNPANVYKIQRALSSKPVCKVDNNASAIISIWDNKIKFNGFFFGINMTGIAPAAYLHPQQLFNNNSVMVGQEDSLVYQMMRSNMTLFPKIATCAFVFHHKSATVSKSRRTETVTTDLGVNIQGDVREQISFYHPEMVSSASPELRFPNLYESYTGLQIPSYNLQDYNASTATTIRIGLFVSDPVKQKSAGDVFTAVELAHAITVKYSNAQVQLVYKGSSWYNARTLEVLDVAIALVDDFDVAKALAATSCDASRCYATNPKIVMIAWMRNWFDRWLSRPYIGNYDHLLTSSQQSKTYFEDYPLSLLSVKCSQYCTKISQSTLSNRRARVPVSILQLATNPDRFRPGRPVHLLQSDYVFTGSYHKQYRRIMDFQPEMFSEFKGFVIGSDWNNANVSAAWANLTIGPLPYSQMPEVYRSTKIVIDDANHVTAPWGSVNSRVFDALASGALVITNGKLGSDSSFSSQLPYYSTIDELHHKLSYYLHNRKARRDLTQKLRLRVLLDHTYLQRASELQAQLGLMHVHLKSKSQRRTASDDETIPRALCVGIRTYPRQSSTIETLLRTLTLAANQSSIPNKPSLHIYIVNTEDSSAYLLELQNIIRNVHANINNAKTVQLHVLQRRPGGKIETTDKNSFFGYDTTDDLVQYLTEKDRQCEWIMLTNGDNAYNSAWYDAVVPSTKDHTLSLLAWDFVTHHQRQGLTEQRIQVALKRGSIDLGSILVRSSVYKRSQIEFLPDSVFTNDLFARDFYVVEEMLNWIPNNAIKFLRRTLLFHQ